MEASGQQEYFCQVCWTHKLILVQGHRYFTIDTVPSIRERLLSAITGFFTKLVTLVLQLPALQVSVIALIKFISMIEKSSEFIPNE